MDRTYFRRLSDISCLLPILLLVCWSSVALEFSGDSIDTTIPLVRDFQKIGDGPDKLYVYSAYFDEFRGADRSSVRILGGVKTRFAQPLYCKFYNKNGRHYSTIEAQVRANSEHFGLEYSASFITCRVTDFFTLPAFVSLVESALDAKSVTNVLRIKYPEQKKREEKVEFAVCVQPTYNWDRPLQFLEWMEFHKLMGVQKFTFYNVSIGPETSCLMHTYDDQVEILPWSNNYAPDEEIRMYGQFIGAQDCLYRHRGVSEFMIYVDLDEMIVPRYGSNYSQFFGFLEKELHERHDFHEDIVSYNFRNGFFFDEWQSDPQLPSLKIHGNQKADDIIRQLQISKMTRRAKQTEPHDMRSKFIVIPEKAIELGNHAVYEAAGNTKRVAVPEELAYSHHYRECLGDFCEVRESIIERSAQRFAEQVALQVADRLHTTAKHCNIFHLDEEDVEETDPSNGESLQDLESSIPKKEELMSPLPNLLSSSNQKPEEYHNSSLSDWSLNSLIYKPYKPNYVVEPEKGNSQFNLFGVNLFNKPMVSKLSTNEIKESLESSGSSPEPVTAEQISPESLDTMNSNTSSSDELFPLDSSPNAAWFQNGTSSLTSIKSEVVKNNATTSEEEDCDDETKSNSEGEDSIPHVVVAAELVDGANEPTVNISTQTPLLWDSTNPQDLPPSTS